MNKSFFLTQPAIIRFVKPRSPEAALLFTMVSSFFLNRLRLQLIQQVAPSHQTPPVMMAAPVSGIAFKIGSNVTGDFIYHLTCPFSSLI